MVIVLHVFVVAMHVFIYYWVDYMGSEWFRDNMDLFYIDINECSLSNGGCAQVCNNSIGSYVCSCNAGYNLENDNHTCSGYFYLFLFWIIVTQISMNVNLIMVAVLTYVSILLEVISVNVVMGISQLMMTL